MPENDTDVKWFNTKFFPNKRTAKAVYYEEKILPRLRKEEIIFFTPWGPRYDWEIRGTAIAENDLEIETLRFLSQIFSELKMGMPDKNFRWMFMGADLYGTRINNLPEEIVAAYFKDFKKRLSKIIPDAEFQLWSEFDQRAKQYRQQVQSNFNEYVDGNILMRATKTARAMGRNSNPKEYLIERIAEALLIEKKYHPIKLSCAPRHKDDKVDCGLPRLYFLPGNLQAPWLQKEGIKKI